MTTTPEAARLAEEALKLVDGMLAICQLVESTRAGAAEEMRSASTAAADELRAIIAALSQPDEARDAPKPLDDPRLQELFTSCIDGALTSGYQGVAVPPEGHWLAFWWKKGQAVAMVEEGSRRAAMSKEQP